MYSVKEKRKIVKKEKKPNKKEKKRRVKGKRKKTCLMSDLTSICSVLVWHSLSLSCILTGGSVTTAASKPTKQQLLTARKHVSWSIWEDGKVV